MIRRTGTKPNFTYMVHDKPATPELVAYAKSLTIPPAYTDVFIPPPPNKILYFGKDIAGRSQFIYSPWWVKQAREAKYCTLIKFAEQFPQIQQAIKKTLQNANPQSHEYAISLILAIINACYFRVGNIKYEKLYNSHGISTIMRKHLKIHDGKMRIKFIGKKAVLNECISVDPLIIQSLERLLTTINPSPQTHVFQVNGERVSHIHVNNFLKQFDPEFTSKLFRTLDSNIYILNRLKTYPQESPAQRKSSLRTALNEVSAIVHNTPAIAKKDYVDPELIDVYLNHPKKFKIMFPAGDSRPQFIKWLKQSKKCPSKSNNV